MINLSSSETGHYEQNNDHQSYSYRSAQRKTWLKMNILSRRLLLGTCFCLRSSFLRSYSSTSRQEFGRQFEEIVAKSLRKLSFDVAVCGGPKDRGADLRGVWLLKSSSVPVIGQCKRYKKRLGPRHLREMEGTLSHEVKGTLGIIVSESGYSKDAYEVFIGSLYPIALTSLSGYSDDLLQWYSNERNDEQFVSKYVASKESDGSHARSSTCINETVLNVHQYHGQDYKNLNSNQENIVCGFNDEEDISMKSDECNSFRTSTMASMSQANGFKDSVSNLRWLTNSDISEVGSGVFTMFELNLVARKLLPNLVVGMKYTRHNSKAFELFINEDDSFIPVTYE